MDSFDMGERRVRSLPDALAWLEEQVDSREWIKWRDRGRAGLDAESRADYDRQQAARADKSFERIEAKQADPVAWAEELQARPPLTRARALELPEEPDVVAEFASLIDVPISPERGATWIAYGDLQRNERGQLVIGTMAVGPANPAFGKDGLSPAVWQRIRPTQILAAAHRALQGQAEWRKWQARGWPLDQQDADSVARAAAVVESSSPPRRGRIGHTAEYLRQLSLDVDEAQAMSPTARKRAVFECGGKKVSGSIYVYLAVVKGHGGKDNSANTARTRVERAKQEGCLRSGPPGAPPQFEVNPALQPHTAEGDSSG